MAHECQTVEDHHQHHSHVLGQREQQTAEVFTLRAVCLGVEPFCAQPPAEQAANIAVQPVFNLFQSIFIGHFSREKASYDGVTSGTSFAGSHQRRFHGAQQGRKVCRRRFSGGRPTAQTPEQASYVPVVTGKHPFVCLGLQSAEGFNQLPAVVWPQCRVFIGYWLHWR